MGASKPVLTAQRASILGSFLHRSGGILLLLIVTEREAFALAYTDPGSGALLWQMLVAAFVGAAFYFRRFLSWVKSKKKDHELDK